MARPSGLNEGWDSSTSVVAQPLPREAVRQQQQPLRDLVCSRTLFREEVHHLAKERGDWFSKGQVCGEGREGLGEVTLEEVVCEGGTPTSSASEKLYCAHAERVDVDRVVGDSVKPLLWSHVAGRAILHRAGDPLAIKLCSGNTEVEHLDPAVSRDEQVGRLDVSMNDREGLPSLRAGRGVGDLQGIGDGSEELEDSPGWEHVIVAEHGRIDSVDILHEHRRPPLDRDEVKDLDDGVVVELGEQARLVALPRSDVVVLVELSGENLHRESLLKAVLSLDICEIDRSKASLTEGLNKSNSALKTRHQSLKA